MFRIKYNISLLDSKWNPIKRNIIFDWVPRKDEYIFYDNIYYHVINLVHSVNKKHEIFLVVEELQQQEEIKNG
jgi:hypothetical protein